MHVVRLLTICFGKAGGTIENSFIRHDYVGKCIFDSKDIGQGIKAIFYHTSFVFVDLIRR